MIDVDLKTWQRLFPELVIKDEERNCKCGRPWGGWKTFLHLDLAGIEATACECGMPGWVVCQPRNKEANDKWMKALSVFTQPKRKPKLKVVQCTKNE